MLLVILVALLTECVDRNINHLNDPATLEYVALLTECVDRNSVENLTRYCDCGRTPYGVRG